MNFWQKLSVPVVGLAPMDGVSDQPFRHIQKKYGAPAVVYTEFTSTEGVCHGADRLLQDFLYDQTQRPIVAQIYGTTPEYFRQTATLLVELGFDGIDINMGCPAKNVAHSGAGAALIKTPQLAQQIVLATKAGVADFFNGKRAKDCPDITPKIANQVSIRHQELPLNYQHQHFPDRAKTFPVSVKTRIGYHQPVVRDWISTLLETQPALIAVHGRTLKQQYGGMADWDQIAVGAELAHQAGILYLGNGDVVNYHHAAKYSKTYGVDGVLIGRGSFGNPFVFKPSYQPDNVDRKKLLEIAIEHAQLFENTYDNHPKYNFLPMRKHLGWYCKDFAGAKELRIALFSTNTAAEAKQLITTFLEKMI